MTKKIDTVFVLALITLFSATAFLLVLIGAKQYRHITNTMNENYEDRTISSYLTEKIRQHDKNGSISIVTLEGVTALSLKTTENDDEYITYIYCYNHTLCELIASKNSVFTLSGGQEIIPVQQFMPTFISDSLVHIAITDTNGDVLDLYLPIHGNSRKEDS